MVAVGESVLTPIWPGYKYAVSVIAHGMDHTLKRITGSGSEYDVLCFHDMYRIEGVVGESGHGFAKPDISTV